MTVKILSNKTNYFDQGDLSLSYYTTGCFVVWIYQQQWHSIESDKTEEGVRPGLVDRSKGDGEDDDGQVRHTVS